MEFAHYRCQMNRLIDRFGEKAYGDDFLQLLWSEVKEFENGWMTKTVSDFIYTARQPPLGAEWREKISDQRNYLWQSEQREPTQWDEKPADYICVNCFNRGFTIDDKNYVWKCKCVAGKKRLEMWPIAKSTS